MVVEKPTVFIFWQKNYDTPDKDRTETPLSNPVYKHGM